MSFKREIWTPALVFSAHDTELILREAQIRTARIISALASVPNWILGNAGVPIIFGESIAWLIRFSVDVEGVKTRFIEAKLEESAVTSAISRYQAKMRGIQGRLDRLLRDISKKERELEVVPAFMACQETLALFEDNNYPFWTKPEISTPLLVSFAGIFVAVCKMTVELMESYREDAEKELKMLGDVVDDYRRRFLCFRLYKAKYPIFPSKDIIDKYDENLRTTTRNKTTAKFDCFCLHKQYYSLKLSEVYGSFFDSAKVAIIESELLAPGETLKNEWCTEHKRCTFALEIQKSCFCKKWNPDESYLRSKDEEVEEAIKARVCILSVSSSDTFVRHYQYTCKTCNFEDNMSFCQSCMLTCHEGHDIEFLRYGWFSCDCADSSNTKCQFETESESAETEAPEIITNKDGVAVIRGRGDYSGGDTGLKASELYYCGRQMNQCRCGTCDEFCGPINGCPCDSCRELVFPDPKKYEWPSVVCSNCDETIVGERYKCRDCKNYDLCGVCISEEVHISHDFLRMMKTLNDVDVLDVHRFVGCDGCSEYPLCGQRFKCTQCEDYDLCTSCRDSEVHEHDTFMEILSSERKWVIDAMKNVQSPNSDLDSDAGSDAVAASDLDSDSYTDHIKKACVLFERDPKIPFDGMLTLEENTVFYAININGRIPRKPHTFEVNILFEDKILFHITHGWNEQKTVLNSFEDEWGRKEYTFFESLVPKSKFDLGIVFKDGSFQITVNDEDTVYFARRVMDEPRELMVEVKGDIIPKLITFDLHNVIYK